MQMESTVENKGQPPHGPKPHTVEVIVDNVATHVQAKNYRVSEFKELVGVSADRELEQIVNGQLTPLDDNGHLHIKGGEKFVSHVRAGGSS